MDEPADELLTGGGLPRWFQLVGVLAIVGVLAYLLATRVTGESRPSAARPTPLPTDPVSPTPAFDPTRAYAVVVAGNSQWSVEGSRLIRSSPGDTTSIPLAFLQLPAKSRPILALDAAHGVIWLVVANAVPTRMVGFDSRTLDAVHSATWRQVVDGAAAVNGYLYLASDSGVAELSPGATQPHFISGLRGALGPIAADPVGNQLVALDVSNPLAVWTYRHGELPRQSELRLPISKGTVAVAGGNIWVGGFGVGGAVLFRLDPETLQPVAGGRAPEFGPGAVLVAGGRRVVWVRAGNGLSDLLVCLDASSGQVEQRFHLFGDDIASTGGYAVLTTAQGVLNLALDGCTG
ncbi:MAG: hypothetical protein QOH89_2575 [Pseudonocardiales bacterium]|nr:hypothetical protein [Pseudonocardiales bacterium]MDT4940488.1 hypothetical protein [Pseudonocardiales bacterium]